MGENLSVKLLDLLMQWLVKPITDGIMETFNNTMFQSAFKNVFYIEDTIGLDGGLLSTIQMLIFGFATTLLTLKLLHKLFGIYIIGVDGDNTVSPLEYFKSYMKGLIVIAVSTIVYGWFIDIITDFTQQIIDIVGMNGFNIITGDFFKNALSGAFLLVYCIFMVILYINFMLNGIRMLFLRLALPFACVGLIDNDNGIYSIFIKKMTQTAITASVQIVLVQISLIPMYVQGPSDSYFIPLITAIAILSYSLKITTDLNEIFLAGAASGAGQKISALGRGVQSVVGFAKGLGGAK